MPPLARLLAAPHANVLAMLHVPALPGTPAATLTMPQVLLLLLLLLLPLLLLLSLLPAPLPQIVDRVLGEAATYLSAGVDGLVLENMHDAPYCLEPDLGPHVGAAMAVVAAAVRGATPTHLPVGVQVGRADMTCSWFQGRMFQ